MNLMMYTAKYENIIFNHCNPAQLTTHWASSEGFWSYIESQNGHVTCQSCDDL